jgi:hypothetical protein
METYKGDGDCGDLCCLNKEGKKQTSELREMRIKYDAKILLSYCNLVKSNLRKKLMDSGTYHGKKRSGYMGLPLKPSSCVSRLSTVIKRNELFYVVWT